MYKSDKIPITLFTLPKTLSCLKYYNRSPNTGLTNPPINDITGLNKANKASNIFFTSYKSLFDFISYIPNKYCLSSKFLLFKVSMSPILGLLGFIKG